MDILLLSDGRPGHYRLSEGVVAAIERRIKVKVQRLEVRNRLRLPRAAVPKLLARLPSRIGLNLLHGLGATAIERPDLIVSAGGLTLGANVALAREWGVANVFCGSTRGFPEEQFALVLSDRERAMPLSNVLISPKPTPMDPDRLRSPEPLSSLRSETACHVGVLAGGPTACAKFVADDWSRFAALLGCFMRDLGWRITVVTAPRTPPEAYVEFERLAGLYSQHCEIVDFRSAGPGSVNRALDADLVIVTADSMAMMTEAALSRRPAVALRPAATKPSRDDRAVDHLVAENCLAVVDLADCCTESILVAAASLTPLQHNHLDSLANRIWPFLTTGAIGDQGR